MGETMEVDNDDVEVLFCKEVNPNKVKVESGATIVKMEEETKDRLLWRESDILNWAEEEGSCHNVAKKEEINPKEEEKDDYQDYNDATSGKQ